MKMVMTCPTCAGSGNCNSCGRPCKNCGGGGVVYVNSPTTGGTAVV